MRPAAKRLVSAVDTRRRRLTSCDGGQAVQQLLLYSGPERQEALPDVTVEKGL